MSIRRPAFTAIVGYLRRDKNKKCLNSITAWCDMRRLTIWRHFCFVKYTVEFEHLLHSLFISNPHMCRLTLEISSHIKAFLILNNCFHLCPYLILKPECELIWASVVLLDLNCDTNQQSQIFWHLNTHLWCGCHHHFMEDEKPLFLTNTLRSMVRLNLSSSTWNKVILCSFF